jgi:hypothetical protein
LKPSRLTITLFVILSLFMAGCTSGLREPLRKVDRFFQDLGQSIKHTTRKITGEQPTGKQINYQPQNGLVLTIQKASIAPTKVNNGQQVKLTLQYVLMGAPTAGLKVTEKSLLFRGDKELTVLKDESTTKENGTWEDTLTFAVPDSATPGKYTVLQEISAQGLTRSSRRSFTVQ